MGPISKEVLFERAAEQGLALTFDDMRLNTARSHITSAEIDVSSMFSRGIPIPNPFVTAAMRSVTGPEMAIAAPKNGGIGLVPVCSTPEEQKEILQRVKYELSGLIDNPITAKLDLENGLNPSMGDVMKMLADIGRDYRKIPVVGPGNVFLGLLTGRNFDLKSNDTLVADAMTHEQEITKADPDSTPAGVYELMQKHQVRSLPLVDANGILRGLYVLKDIKRIMDGNPENYNLDKDGRLVVAAGIPTDPEQALARIAMSMKYADAFFISTADGDSVHAFETIRAVREVYGDSIQLIGGNITNPFSARDLIEAGVDGILVGQGGGAACTTRNETGVGIPQMTSVYECAHMADQMKGTHGVVPIGSDGAQVHRGDAPLAVAAGAHYVVGGKMFAGTTEAPGAEVVIDGVRYKSYYGEASPRAFRENGTARYDGGIIFEGVEGYEPSKGPVEDVFRTRRAALVRGMSYCGSRNIEEHRDVGGTNLRRITKAGRDESHPHDIKISSV